MPTQGNLPAPVALTREKLTLSPPAKIRQLTSLKTKAMNEIFPALPVKCKFRSTFVWLSGMFSAFRCNYSWFTTGRSSPASVAAFSGLPSATGRIPFGRPVRSSRTLTTGLWTDRPLLGGCGKVTSRPWQFQWVTMRIYTSYC